ncbi:MAG: hypothetical protein JSS02_01885 [Planctomycetes bacterium]|nr:hypothetical protein [Planctomycetota bacterium]
MKNEFKTDLLIGTEQISSGIGQPAFSGGPATSGFPDDQDANALSLWNLPNARLMLQLTHQDRELPFIICLVVAPRDD